MAIAAHLETGGKSDEGRGAPRRTLRFETLGERPSGDSHIVQVHNASSTGLLLESGTELTVGDTIAVVLPETGATTAHVVWTSGTLYGCRFDEPISAAALSAAQLRSDAGLELTQAPQTVSESFGSRLQRLRKERGFTLAQLAERLGVSKPTVWAWEKGKARPLESRIAAIAEVFGVPEGQLADVQDNAEAREVLARSREAVARAFGAEPENVRIMIEL